MARPGPGEGSGGDGETLGVEQQALNIMADSRLTLAKGAERFNVTGNPREHMLKKAIEDLGSTSLAKLAAGEDMPHMDTGDGTLRYQAGLWSGEEMARRVYRQARALYIEDQKKAVGELLGGKLLTVKRRWGAEQDVLEFSNGAAAFEVTDNQVTGMFEEVQIANGALILLPTDDPQASVHGNHWRVRPFGREGIEQQVEISVTEHIDR